MEKETHQEKRKRLEAKLTEIGLTNFVLFGEFEGEIIPALVGEPGRITDIVLEALEKDVKLLNHFAAMLQGMLERKTEQQGMPVPRGWPGKA
jgi:hypothetical protein